MAMLLEELLPKIIKNEKYQLIPHEGKQDLLKSIPRKLRGWNVPNTKFIVIHDQDSNDCKELKSKIVGICKPYNQVVTVRIACHELEAWYLGDLDAVESAYGINLKAIRKKIKKDGPDSIVSPKRLIKNYIPNMTQLDGAKRIAKKMRIDNNQSYSFRIFIETVRKYDICEEAVV